MDQVEFYVRPRSVTGKKVKRLRRAGLVPLVVYGSKREPMNLQATEFDALRAIARAGGQLIAVHVEGEDRPRMALARDVQRDAITGSLLHADLYEVDITSTIQIEVPLSFVGEPRLVGTGEAILVSVMNSVMIECLPTEIVQSIEVDLSDLAEMDDAIHVRDLPALEHIRVLTDPDEMIARLEPVMEEEEEEVEEELFAMPSAEDVEVIQRGRAEEEEEE